MSEESCDYIDCRTCLRRLASSGEVEVLVTRHALERLAERRVGGSWRAKPEALADIIRNVVRDGYYKATTSRLMVWTRKYLLVCCIDRYMRLNVITVISRDTLREGLRERLRGGFRIRWRSVSLRLPRGFRAAPKEPPEDFGGGECGE